MRLLSTLLCLCLLQACSFTQSSTQKIPSLFPFEQNFDDDAKLYLDLNKTVATKPFFTQKAKQSFTYLALDEAIRNDDYAVIIEVSEALLGLTPNSQFLSDAASWLLTNGYLEETRTLLEHAAVKLPDDLAIHVMLSEAIFLQEEKNTEAITGVLESYVARYPTQYVAYMELALAYLKVNNPEKAYSTFSQLPESEKPPMVLYYIGFSLKKLGRIDEAVAVLEKSLKVMPDFLEVLLELAQIEEARKNYAVARKYYNHILGFDIYNQDILLRLVAIALKEGNPNRALDIVQENLDSFDFIVNASSMLLGEGRADLVETLLSQMAKQDDAPRELIYLQGALAYEGMKNHGKALSFLKLVIPQDKYYKNSLELKTQIYLEQDKLTEAIATLQEARRIFKDDMNFLTMEYQIYLYLGEYAKALPLLTEYTEQNPDDHEATLKYAFVHKNLGMNDKAFEIMEHLLEKDPDNADALNFVGYILVEQKKNLKYALGLLQKANTISPHSDYILDSLALAYYQMKDYQEAWIYMKQAVSYIKENLPKDPTIWEHYGDIAFALGKLDEAKLGWERSVKIKKNEEITKKLSKIK